MAKLKPGTALMRPGKTPKSIETSGEVEVLETREFHHVRLPDGECGYILGDRIESSVFLSDEPDN